MKQDNNNSNDSNKNTKLNVLPLPGISEILHELKMERESNK